MFGSGPFTDAVVMPAALPCCHGNLQQEVVFEAFPPMSRPNIGLLSVDPSDQL